MTNEKNASFPLRLPKSMQLQVREFARREGISLNQFINIALAEKIVRLSLAENAKEPPLVPKAHTTDSTSTGFDRDFDLKF